MKVVVSRAIDASCIIDNKEVSHIDNGLMLLVGFTSGDDSKIIDYMVRKIVNLRIFDDDNHVMNKSILDVGGEILSISQFTLYANTKKGNRPSYIEALSGDEAVILYDEFNEKLKEYANVKTGVFGANMKIKYINDGPITIILERGVEDA